MRRVVDLVSSGMVDSAKLEGLVTHVFPLKEIERAFQTFSDYDAGAIKIAIQP